MRVLEQPEIFINHPITLNGWVVLMDKNLYILDIDNKDFDAYEESPKIRIQDRDIAYAILNSISNFIGGGISCIFYQATVAGTLIKDKEDLLLEVDSLAVDEETRAKDFTQIDISSSSIEEGKLRNPHLFSDNPSRDWLDYM